MNLIEKNNEMLEKKAYKLADERLMLKISSLSNPNDYDMYLIACCLCNYPIEEIAEARELRMQYFKATNGGKIYGFEHPVTDYKKVTSSVYCKNTGVVNKYGLYEYEININDKNLVSDLWSFKDKNCLKYVDAKTYEDKLIVSISRDQLNHFIKVLDKFMIGYDLEDIENGLFYKNKSNNKLIDISKLTLPFKPYPYQIEDAEKIIRKKRLLLGHEMGCFAGNTKVLLANGSWIRIEELVKFDTFLVRTYDTELKQFTYSKATATKTRENAELICINYHSPSKKLSIYCTPDHKFLVDNNDSLEWIEAKDLKHNMKLISENDVYVDDIEYTNRKEDVYCLTVNNTHNFIIDGGIVVHNCGKTFISVLVGGSIVESKDIVYKTTDFLDYNDIVITDQGELPIGKIVEENIDCKVQVCKNGRTSFVDILDRKCIEE